ncbi:hypothetical protein NQZ68_002017 [Dissostichus eleginoides]|nr:hypothetical protein NQZ68_002017 [Dissostichus eleginoides]
MLASSSIKSELIFSSKCSAKQAGAFQLPANPCVKSSEIIPIAIPDAKVAMTVKPALSLLAEYYNTANASSDP